MTIVTNSLFQYLTPIYPKKEICLNLPVYTPPSFFPGKTIDCSPKWITWISTSNGYKVAPLISSNAKPNDQTLFGLAQAHQSAITNIEFSPFKDNYFTTSSLDHYIKFWEIDEQKKTTKRVGFIDMERDILFSQSHPTVENVMSVACNEGKIFIVDITKSLFSEINLNGVNDDSNAMNWKKDGSLLSILSRGGSLSIVDPRKRTVVESFNTTLTDGKIIWPESKDLVLLFGKHNSKRVVECRDVRNLKNVVSSLCLDDSNEDLLPIFDYDTGIILCPSRNETTCFVAQLNSANHISLLNEINLRETTISCTAVPKSSLNVMSAEVMRLIQLTSKGCSPFSFNVPSKEHSALRQELFPDTSSRESPLTLEEWRNGSNKMVKKISLNPDNGMKRDNETTFLSSNDKLDHTTDLGLQIKDLEISDVSSVDYTNFNAYQLDMEKYSKFRYIDSQPYPKTTSFTAYNQIFMTTSGESTGVACIKDILVLPIRGSGGKLGVVKLSNPHRIPSTGPFSVENGSIVNDFVLDPFDEQTLVAVCENGTINVWKLPEGGLTDNLTTPSRVMKGHKNRSTLLKYHHMAKNVVASSDVAGVVKIWDLNQGNEALSCSNESDSQITGMTWDPKGISLVTTSMDKKFAIFDPRKGSSPAKSAICSEAAVGSKVEWADDNLLLISTLKLDGKQTLKKIDLRKPDECLAELLSFASPSPYILFYDRDINVAFGFNKGGNTIQPIELRNDGNGFFLCDPYKSFEPHQTVAFLRKDALNVGNIEIAKSIRILDNTTELVKHKLLRSNEEYFQDDIFPPTDEMWNPSMSSSEWLSGKNTPLNKVSLAPKNMIPLSQAKDLLVTTNKKYDSKLELAKAAQNVDEEFDIVSQFIDKVAEHESKMLPQDAMEGLSDSEWND